MSTKINTQTIRQATAQAVVAGKKAHDTILDFTMKGIVLTLVFGGAFAVIMGNEQPQTANASEFVPEEGRYTPPPKTESLISDPEKVEENVETPKQAKPFLTDEVKAEMVGIIDSFLLEQQSPMAGQGKVFVSLSEKYNRHPYAVVAITGADTSFGKRLLTPFNAGNIGNNDRGDKVNFASWEQGIEAIYQTLNNNYLGNATKLCHLSFGGYKTCPEASGIMNGKIYASSPENWERNTNYWFSYLLLQPYSNQFSIILSDYYQISIG